MRAASVSLAVAVEDRDRGLDEDGTAVGPLVDDVHGASGHAHARRQRLADGVEAGERRQQARVDIENLIFKLGQQDRPDTAA